MNAPLGAEYGNHVTTTRKCAFKHHHAGSAGMDWCAMLGKNINAFMHTGGAPWVMPITMGIPVFVGGLCDWNDVLLRHQITQNQYRKYFSFDEVDAHGYTTS